jgi:hypothetical protein
VGLVFSLYMAGYVLTVVRVTLAARGRKASALHDIMWDTSRSKLLSSSAIACMLCTCMLRLAALVAIPETKQWHRGLHSVWHSVHTPCVDAWKPSSGVTASESFRQLGQDNSTRIGF